jgi:hypothetical protein
MRVGWWGLFVFSAFGLLLESMHGFKMGFYLDVSNDTRRLMWRLAHVHGGLLGVVHILFGLSLRSLGEGTVRHLRTASLSLITAGVLLPLGFFLGGLVFYGGDPGLAVLLVPVGAVMLLSALCLTAASMGNVTPSQPRRAKGGMREQGANRTISR